MKKIILFFVLLSVSGKLLHVQASGGDGLVDREEARKFALTAVAVLTTTMSLSILQERYIPAKIQKNARFAAVLGAAVMLDQLTNLDLCGKLPSLFRFIYPTQSRAEADKTNDFYIIRMCASAASAAFFWTAALQLKNGGFKNRINLLSKFFVSDSFLALLIYRGPKQLFEDILLFASYASKTSPNRRG